MRQLMLEPVGIPFVLQGGEDVNPKRRNSLPLTLAMSHSSLAASGAHSLSFAANSVISESAAAAIAAAAFCACLWPLRNEMVWLKFASFGTWHGMANTI